MTKITKAEFETLPESLKTKFIANGDDYVLQEEDVEGLKKSKAEILAEKKAAADKLAAAEAKLQEYAERDAAVDDKAKRRAGAFEELEAKLRARITELETEKTTAVNDLLGTLKQERVKNFLTENGVKADRAHYALGDVLDEFDIEAVEKGFKLKLKNGIGDANELTDRVAKLKEASPFLFDSTAASGSGASGSNGGGGAKTMPESQFDSLSPKEQAAFVTAGGQVI